MAQFGDFTVDRNSTKYVLGSGGDIISYATDEPAFEFNADGSYKGLLVEPAATNVFTYSEDFSDVSWSGGSLSLISGISSPDGGTSAFELIPDNASSGLLYKDFSVVSGTTYSISIFAKANTFSHIQFGTWNGFTSKRVNFNLSTGVVGDNDTGGLATITNFGSGWYRCSLSVQATSTRSDGRIFFKTATSDSEARAAATGDGTSGIYIWGAQLETGPIATSYIPTTTASVTRVKDDITQTGAQSLIGQTEGTLYVEVDWRLTAGTNQILLEVNDGSTNDRIIILNRSSPVELRMYARANGGTPQTEQGESSTAYSGIQKIAFAYKTDDFELYRNGSSISSDTSGSLAALATLTDIDLGQSNAATNQVNMWIRAVALYPKRLSDAECQALTTL